MKIRQRGFTTVEYIVVGLAAVAALLLPYIDGKSAVEVLVEAIKVMWADFNYGISLSNLP